MTDLHFLHPQWLWLLCLVPLFGLLALRHRRNTRGWDNIVDPELAPFVLTGQNRRSNAVSLLVFSLLAALAILAAAGPAWEKREVPVFREQQALVVALDLSASMLAQDVSPSRLEQARFKLIDLLNTRKDGQTGLVVFAGDAFVVSPLTDDIRTIEAQMKSLTPGIMPAQGSQVDLAIQRAVELLQQANAPKGAILLMTDGASDLALARQAAQEALGKGFPVSVLAFGTEQGAPIPLGQGGFLQGADGKTVVPQLDISGLRSLAQAGGGLFAEASLDDADINRLGSQWLASTAATDLLQGGDRQVDTWVNEGVWLIVLMLPLAALLFRRGWMMSLALVLVLPHSDPLYAGWADVWQTPDQQAQAALQAGQPREASQLFENPNWKAAAAYKAGDFETAARLYAQDAGVESQYNLGNALARLGRIQQAIDAYERVLAQNPQHEDAKYNRDLLKKQQEQQQQAQNQNQDQNQQNNQQNNQQGNQSQQQSGADAQQQEQRADPQNQQQQSAQQADEQNQQKNEQQQAEQAKNAEAEQQNDQRPEQSMDQQTREQKQATEQWLRRIPDDPAGLWRRKFQYQYQQRARPAQGGAW